jgi:hypothetical protein
MAGYDVSPVVSNILSKGKAMPKATKIPKVEKHGAKEKINKGKPPHVHIHKADSGGFMARHVHEGMGAMGMGGAEQPKDEEHILPTLADVHEHLDKTFGPHEEMAEGGAGGMGEEKAEGEMA